METEEVKALRRSLGGHKGHATKYCNQIKRLGPMQDTAPSPRGLAEFEDLFDKLKAQVEKSLPIYDAIHAAAATDEAAAAVKESKDTFEATFNDVRVYVLQKLCLLYTSPSPRDS